MKQEVITSEMKLAIKKRLNKSKRFEGYTSILKWLNDKFHTNVSYNTVSQYVRRNYGNPAAPKRLDNLKIKETKSFLKRRLSEGGSIYRQRKILMLMIVNAKTPRTMKSISRELKINVYTLRIWINNYKEGGFIKLIGRLNGMK